MLIKDMYKGVVPYHKTWDIHDSTKLNTFLECPRKYFYEYVLGWRPEGTSHDLVFGEAWHRAMECLLERGYTSDAIKEGFDRFLEYYHEHYPAGTGQEYFPKTPEKALEALVLYVAQYGDDLRKYEVLYTEVGGSVPIIDGASITFRFDALMRDKTTEEFFVLEHKTTKRAGRTWVDQWALSIQVGTYTHALYCLYGHSKVYGVRVNGAVFKKESEFIRVPVKKTYNSMRVWYNTVQDTILRIIGEFEDLSESKVHGQVLSAFPLNPTACTKYWGCPYFDLCVSWANPLRHCAEVPMGYEEFRWDPSDREAKTIIEIDDNNIGGIKNESADK